MSSSVSSSSSSSNIPPDNTTIQGLSPLKPTQEPAAKEPLPPPIRNDFGDEVVKKIAEIETKPIKEVSQELIKLCKKKSEESAVSNILKMGIIQEALTELVKPENIKKATLSDLLNFVAKIKQEYSNELNLVKKEGWEKITSALKKNPDHDQAERIESFRLNTVGLMEQICLKILQLTGSPNPGTFLKIGTKGMNSDIDLIHTPRAGEIDEEMRLLISNLFDLLWLGIFDGTPGFQVDTQCYPEHPAVAFDSLANIEKLKANTMDEDIQGFYFQEYAMALLQCRRTYMEEKGGEAKWGDFYNKFRKALSNSNSAMATGLKSLIKDVNKFEEANKTAISEIKAKNQLEPHDAKRLYHAKLMVKLAKKMAAVHEKLQNTELSNEEKSKLLLEQAFLGALHLSCLPEVYYPHSTYLVICRLKGSQKEQTFMKILENQKKEYELKEPFGFFNPVVAFRESKQDLIFSQRQSMKPTHNQMLVSAIENFGKLVGHLDSAIDASKYYRRCIQGIQGALKETKKPEFYNQVESDVIMSRNLENCKRKVLLCSVAVRKFLLEEIAKDDGSDDRGISFSKAEDWLEIYEEADKFIKGLNRITFKGVFSIEQGDMTRSEWMDKRIEAIKQNIELFGDKKIDVETFVKNYEKSKKELSTENRDLVITISVCENCRWKLRTDELIHQNDIYQAMTTILYGITPLTSSVQEGQLNAFYEEFINTFFSKPREIINVGRNFYQFQNDFKKIALSSGNIEEKLPILAKDFQSTLKKQVGIKDKLTKFRLDNKPKTTKLISFFSPKPSSPKIQAILRAASGFQPASSVHGKKELDKDLLELHKRAAQEVPEYFDVHNTIGLQNMVDRTFKLLIKGFQVSSELILPKSTKNQQEELLTLIDCLGNLASSASLPEPNLTDLDNKA